MNNATTKSKRQRTQHSPQQLSRALSWALRHHAVELNLTMRSDGFVPLVEILNCQHPKLRGCTAEQIQQVVATNDKQRFALQEKPASDYCADSPFVTASEGTIWCIRANQGHSLDNIIDSEKLLTVITPEQLKTINCIVHGTYLDAWKQIQTKGYLSRMNRQHIHFAQGMPGEVVSGMRKSCQVYIYMNAAKCANEGIVFYKSANGVLLSPGKEDGTIPLEFIARVETKSGEILMDCSNHMQ